MPNNSLYPGFAKFFYTSNGHGHIHIVPIQSPLDTGGGVWQIGLKGGGNALVSAAFLTYTNVIKALFDVGASIVHAELWTLSSPTADPIFQQDVNLAIAGTAAGAVVPFSQLAVSFRSANGGLYRGVFLETPAAVNIRDDAPLANPGQNAYATTYAIANGSMVSARDGGFLTAVIRSLTKTNDKVREKFLLDV